MTSSVIWVPSSNGSVPNHAFGGCHDVDGSALYIGRAFHEGDTLPAKISPKLGIAYVCYAGAEHAKNEYEVLCKAACSGERLAWKSVRDGEIPYRAVEGGITSDGEKLYIGRVWHEGSLVPGKVQPSHKVLYIPFGGEEKHFDKYEILIEI